MKKKLALMLSCMVLCALVLVGCGGSDKLAGTKWKATKVEVQGVAMEGAVLEAAGGFTMEFTDETTVKMTMLGGMSVEGTYTESENTVTVEFLGEPVNYQREGNKLTGEQDGQVVVFEKE